MLITTHSPKRFHAKPRAHSAATTVARARFRDSVTILSTPVLTAVAAAAITSSVGGGPLAATGMAFAGAVVGGATGGYTSPTLQKAIGFLNGATEIRSDERNLVTATGVALGGLGGLAGAIAGSLGGSPVGVALTTLAVGGTLLAGVRLLDHLDG